MMHAEDVIPGLEERQGIASSLRDLSSGATALRVCWAMIGGHALIAWGVPRDTPEIDVMVASDRVEELAATLVEGFGWVPLEYDDERRAFVVTDVVTLHEQEDPLLRSTGLTRMMIPVRRSAGGPCVKIHPAHLPIEKEAIEASVLREHFSVEVPVAPLGAVLLMKMMAGRITDLGTIEQTAEHLRSGVLQDAVEWARLRDPELAEGLRCMIHVARARRAPVSITRVPRRRKISED